MVDSYGEATFQGHVVHRMVHSGGWSEQSPEKVSHETGLLEEDLLAFLNETQPDECATLASRIGHSWQTQILEYIYKELQRDSGRVLSLLRHGKKIHGVRFRFCWFQPTHRINEGLVQRFEANRLAVLREVHVRTPQGTWGNVDLALFVNGLPVATAELKNKLTGQSVGDAVAQYRAEREPSDPLLSAAVVHFAVDTDRVQMTTKLAGSETRFLPFNRGSSPDGRGGAGNWEPGEGRHATHYLWDVVWERDTWLDLLNRFVHTQPPDPDDPFSGTELIFPRYHQWDAVRKLEEHARERGPGNQYLVQHSAGSGKTNTVAWLAHRLSTLHDDADSLVFDKVVVVTDRRILDDQMQAKVAQFERTGSVGKVRLVERHSDELAEALESRSAKIVVTTLQKFPFVLDKVRALYGSRFAVIVDEAHSSQAGESSAKMREVLSPANLELAERTERELEEGAFDPVEAAVEQLARARGKQENLSIFAFTATPKAKTLELFGTPTTELDGVVRYRPFHLYSMRQAIEEEFILDVLENYIPYDVYYRLSVQGSDEQLEQSKASAAAARYARLHPYAVEQKVAILVEHFREHVAHRVGGQAKAMVVTSSRAAAVRYKRAIDRYVAERGYTDVSALVALSGRVADPEISEDSVSEAMLNGFPESQTARRFDTDNYQVLVVAEKFQTGFDQPLLHTMYVDKRLQGVNAVQTLGRLSRIHPLKEEVFVLDFVNSAEEIQKAFRPYYETTVGLETDPQTLYETWQRLEDHLVVEPSEVAEFADVWFSAEPDDTSVHPRLYQLLAPARERFERLEPQDQDEFRKTLRQFNRMYVFLAQVLPYTDSELERNYAFTRLLERRVAKAEGGGLDLSEDLTLTHFRIEAGEAQSVPMSSEAEALYTFKGEGQGPLTEEEMTLLSEVVERINDKYGWQLDDADKVFLVGFGETMAGDPTIQEQAAANTEENFSYAFDDAFMDAVVDSMERNSGLSKRLLDDEQFASIARQFLLRYVHRRAGEKNRVAEG